MTPKWADENTTEYAVRLALEAEAEACAKIADRLSNLYPKKWSIIGKAAREIADTIRQELSLIHI